MSKLGLWAGLAGATNALQDYFKTKRDNEAKIKMYAMEQDIMQKREEALAQLRGGIQDTNRANASDRAMNRDQFKAGLHSGDVVGQFKDPETNSYYGRRKDGTIVPLNITSDEYQQNLADINKGKAAAAGELAPLRASEINRNNTSTANTQSQMDVRDNTPIPNKQADAIHKDYTDGLTKAHQDWAKQAAAATKAGTAPPVWDANQASQDVTASLYSNYGSDAVKSALGGGNNTPKTPAAIKAASSPTQPSAPTVEGITAAMNAAIKAGKDQNAVEEWGKGLLKKYGYDDGNPDNSSSIDPNAAQQGPPAQ